MITAFVVVTIIESLGHRAYPPPPYLDFRDAEKMRIYMQIVPTGALIYVLLAWIAGAFAGTWLGGSIARYSRILVFVVVCGLLLIAGVANMLMFPHPAWFWCAAIIGIPLAGGLAVLAVRPGTAPTPT